VRKTLETLHEHEREHRYLTSVLDIWMLVYEAGIHPDDVATFTFRPEFLDANRLYEYNRLPFSRKQDVSKHFHNCVRLKTGEIREIQCTPSPGIDIWKKDSNSNEPASSTEKS
jgi:hypothetical protein